MTGESDANVGRVGLRKKRTFFPFFLFGPPVHVSGTIRKGPLAILEHYLKNKIPDGLKNRIFVRLFPNANRFKSVRVSCDL